MRALNDIRGDACAAATAIGGILHYNIEDYPSEPAALAAYLSEIASALHAELASLEICAEQAQEIAG